MGARRPAAASFAVLLALGLGGCALPGLGSEPRPTPSYVPVPDAELFDRAGALPGVVSFDGTFNDTWPEYTYLAEVVVADDADPLDVADHVYAILWQGRSGAGAYVQVVQDNRIISTRDLIPVVTRVSLEERYGPQPGDGTPPGD